ncbi:unnamed protein product, partial [Amoebophrya sp. A120]
CTVWNDCHCYYQSGIFTNIKDTLFGPNCRRFAVKIPYKKVYKNGLGNKIAPQGQGAAAASGAAAVPADHTLQPPQVDLEAVAKQQAQVQAHYIAIDNGWITNSCFETDGDRISFVNTDEDSYYMQSSRYCFIPDTVVTESMVQVDDVDNDVFMSVLEDSAD